VAFTHPVLFFVLLVVFLAAALALAWLLWRGLGALARRAK
jgi:hypothetical protein